MVHRNIEEYGRCDKKIEKVFYKEFLIKNKTSLNVSRKHEMSINFVFVLSSHVRVPPKTKVLLYIARLRDYTSVSFFNKSCT